MYQKLLLPVRYIDALIAAIALASALWVLTQEMLARWFFGTSFLWSEDVSRVLLVFLVYFGAAAVAHDDSHIRVEFLLGALPDKARAVAQLIINIACLAFSLTAVWLGFRLVRDTAMLGMSFAHSGLPMPVWVAQSCIPLAFIMMSIRFLLLIVMGRKQDNGESRSLKEG